MRPIELRPDGQPWLTGWLVRCPGFRPTVLGAFISLIEPRRIDTRAPASRRRDRAVRHLAVRVARLTPIDAITEDWLVEVSSILETEGYSGDVMGRVRTELRRAARVWSLATGERSRVDARHAMGHRLRLPWTASEIAKIGSLLRSRAAKAVLGLIVGGGMYPDELAALPTGAGGARYLRTGPRPGRLRRIVALAEWAQPFVRRHVAKHRDRGARCLDPMFGPHPETRLPKLLELIRRAQIDAGFADRAPLTWADLRGVFVRAARAAGVPEIFIAGHPTPEAWNTADRAATWRRWSRFSKAWTELSNAPLEVPPKACEGRPRETPFLRVARR